jgi:hypothetical protein
MGFPDASNFAWAYTEFAQRYGKDIIEAKGKQIALASEADLTEVKRLLETVKVAEDFAEKCFTKASVTDWSEMSDDQIKKTITFLKSKLN